MSDVEASNNLTAAFAERFRHACDQNPHCPAMGKTAGGGRLPWLEDEYKRRFGEVPSRQSFHKWLTGASRPTLDKAEKLAEMLGVDPAWLWMGHDAALDARAKRARNALADGGVNVVAGLIQMDGGMPAFPEEGDKKARRGHVDLYAVIKGAHYALHVAAGQPVESGVKFAVPTRCDATVLGLIRDGFAFRVVEVTVEVLEAGQRRGGSIEVVLTEEQIAAAAVADFTGRL